MFLLRIIGTMKFDFGNAFKMPDRPEPGPEHLALLTKLAEKIKRRGLAHIALIIVDSTKPVHGIGAQAIYFFMPFFDMVTGPGDSKRFAEMMENPRAVEQFSQMLAEDTTATEVKNGN